MDLNQVCLVGRLTRDAEQKFTASGMAISEFDIAVNRRQKNGDQWEDVASFFSIVVFGKQSENLQQYLSKGKQVAINGSLEQDRWVDKQGQSRSKIKINADSVQLLGGNGGNNGQNQAGGSSW